MLPQLCKNCEHVFQGNFCSNCGQKTNTVRLNWHFIKDEVKYTFLHVNKGFLYTIKQLYTRPGDTVREFIEGKRVFHYKPILLVFVLAGLNGFLSLFLNREGLIYFNNETNQKVMPLISNMMEWIFKHYAVVELVLLPFFSFCSWIAFKKYGYNYIENIIINCFASAHRLTLGLISIPILYCVDPKYMMSMANLLTIPAYGLTVWMFVQLYKKHDLGNVILRLILYGVLTFVTFITLITVATFSYIFYMYQIGAVDINTFK